MLALPPEVPAIASRVAACDNIAIAFLLTGAAVITEPRIHVFVACARDVTGLFDSVCAFARSTGCQEEHSQQRRNRCKSHCHLLVTKAVAASTPSCLLASLILNSSVSEPVPLVSQTGPSPARKTRPASIARQIPRPAAGRFAHPRLPSRSEDAFISPPVRNECVFSSTRGSS